jgi:hypothetical protein
METSDPIIWKILFYVALAGLVAVLFLKKRKQAKDSIDIDYKNQPKNKDDEN